MNGASRLVCIGMPDQVGHDYIAFQRLSFSMSLKYL